MFGFRRREAPSLQLYGKLPLAKDYLRLGLGEGAGLQLREWLDATFSGAAARETAPQLAWPARFLVGDAWQACLMGTIAPSADAGGLRPFPFALCVERRRRAVLDDLQGALAEAEGVWQALRERRERCAGEPDGRSLLAACRGARLTIDAAAPGPAAGGVDVDAWLRALWPDRGRTGLEADLARLLAAPSEGPVRVPFAAGCSQRQQALAWLEILARMGVTPARSCPTVFFPDQPVDPDAVGFLTLFRSAPRAALGAWLCPPTGEALGPADLVGERAAPAVVAVPATEGLPPLAASLRSAVAAALRRAGPGDRQGL